MLLGEFNFCSFWTIISFFGSASTKPSNRRIQEASSSGVNWPWLEADHSPPSSAEVKMCGVIPPLTHCVLIPWCLVKHGLANRRYRRTSHGAGNTVTSCMSRQWRGKAADDGIQNTNAEPRVKGFANRGVNPQTSAIGTFHLFLSLSSSRSSFVSQSHRWFIDTSVVFGGHT